MKRLENAPNVMNRNDNQSLDEGLISTCVGVGAAEFDVVPEPPQLASDGIADASSFVVSSVTNVRE